MDPDPQAAEPGLLRRVGLRAYRTLPRSISMLLVRTLTPNYTLGALCFLEHDGRVLVLRQRHRRGWTLPGGLVDRGEDAAAAVCREVREETGLRIDPGEPLTVVVDPVERRIDVLFQVTAPAPVTVRPSSEAVAARWLEPAELGAVDGSTAQAFAALERIRRDGPGGGRLLDAPS